MIWVYEWEICLIGAARFQIFCYSNTVTSSARPHYCTCVVQSSSSDQETLSTSFAGDDCGSTCALSCLAWWASTLPTTLFGSSRLGRKDPSPLSMWKSASSGTGKLEYVPNCYFVSINSQIDSGFLCCGRGLLYVWIKDRQALFYSYFQILVKN